MSHQGYCGRPDGKHSNLLVIFHNFIPYVQSFLFFLSDNISPLPIDTKLTAKLERSFTKVQCFNAQLSPVTLLGMK